MATLTSVKADVRRLLQDEADSSDDYILSDTSLEELIDEQAIYQYSKDKPYKKALYYRGTGEYSYDLPSDWVNEFSIGLSVENDVDNQIPDEIPEDEWMIFTPDVATYTLDNVSNGDTSVTLSTAGEAIFFKDGDVVTIGDDDATETRTVQTDGVASTGVVIIDTITEADGYDSSPYIQAKRVLRFLQTSFTTSETFLFRYTTTHTLTDSTDTIPAGDLFGFKYLCAAVAADVISNHYKYSTNSSIDADAVDYLTKAEQWETAAKRYYELYKGYVLGSDTAKPDVEGASVVKDLDKPLPWQREPIFHPKEWR